MEDVRTHRLLFAIVLMLFAILVALVGGGVFGLIIGAAALVVALVLPPSRS